ncbi:MAG: hypothetical protein ABIS50_08440 [Luteolibacter sp.]|uniref:hypothetical protein n=1 Tax=Luteolibacter sp. TaxID=1962973 RepID=UPI00326729F9
MKKKNMICWCVMFLCGSVAISRGEDQWDRDQLAKLASMPASATAEDLAYLCDISGAQVNDDDRKVVALVRERILATPDFPEKLKGYLGEERAKWKAGGWFGDYDTRRSSLLDGIGRIPDPRVVKMLGELLPDMEWSADLAGYYASKADWTLIAPNGLLAAESLAKLLKDSPADKTPNFLDKDILVWRAWYDEVKSGKRSFSFIGQNVEYRFRPDGTVENTPPSPVGQPSASVAAPTHTVAKPLWLWILGGGWRCWRE